MDWYGQLERTVERKIKELLPRIPDEVMLHKDAAMHFFGLEGDSLAEAAHEICKGGLPDLDEARYWRKWRRGKQYSRAVAAEYIRSFRNYDLLLEVGQARNKGDLLRLLARDHVEGDRDKEPATTPSCKVSHRYQTGDRDYVSTIYKDHTDYTVLRRHIVMKSYPRTDPKEPKGRHNDLPAPVG